MDDDFLSFCFRFEIGVEGREREGGLSESGIGAEGGLEGAETVRSRGDTTRASGMSATGRSEAACRSCSEAKLDLRVRARGDGGTTVTLGRVLPESVVFTLALLAFRPLALLNKDGGAGLEAWTGSGVDGLRWRDDKSLARGDSSE